MRKKVAAVIIFITAYLFIPYLITVFMTGVLGTGDSGSAVVNNIIKNYDNAREAQDTESYVTGVLAARLEFSNNPEVLKTEAVIYRTYVLYVQGDNPTVNSDELNLNSLSEKEMKSLWGDKYDENYALVKSAVDATKGKYIANNKSPIIPYFHKVSSGSTRTGDKEYISSVASADDILSEDYLSVVTVSNTDFTDKIKDKYSEIIMDDAPVNCIQIVARDSAGYVDKVQIGNLIMSGDEFASIMGLNSSCFSVGEGDNCVIFTVKGDGSGYGLSFYGAIKMAEQGRNFEEILCYYYKNIQIVNE